MNKPSKPQVQITRSRVIDMMSALAAFVMDDETFEKTSPKFKQQVQDGATFIESLDNNSSIFSELDPLADDPIDCVRLGNLATAINNAYSDLCPILAPKEECPIA